MFPFDNNFPVNVAGADKIVMDTPSSTLVE